MNIDYDYDVVTPKKYDHLKSQFESLPDLMPKK